MGIRWIGYQKAGFVKKKAKDCQLGSLVSHSSFHEEATIIAKHRDGNSWVVIGWRDKPTGGAAWETKIAGFGGYDTCAGFHAFKYGWTVGVDEDLVVVEPESVKHSTDPVPAKSEQLELPKVVACSCLSWSKYTGLPHECDKCRGSSALDRRLAAAGRLEEIALTLTGYGELTAAGELNDLAATLRTVGF